ncbi:hypothetical protein C2845_PM01G48310 [Panicum miliaceum]|uniref:Uncharacterized protein n=1 Tax=Panicum miliaceum TaxID=4540 RepID=A0A3L6TI34_PANMI|nr:hypothetical protein C2845_PM01G48310 [Panicum miliaceum]
MDNQKLKDQNKVLENLRVLQGEQVEMLQEKAEELEKVVKKLRETAADNEKVLDNLRKTVEKDATKVAALQREVRELKTKATRKDELIKKLISEAETDHKVMDEAIQEMGAQAKVMEAEVAGVLEGSKVAGTADARPIDGKADQEEPKTLVVVRHVLDVPPMNIGCEGVIVLGSAWERYSFAHPGASFAEFLIACKEDPSIAE